MFVSLVFLFRTFCKFLSNVVRLSCKKENFMFLPVGQVLESVRILSGNLFCFLFQYFFLLYFPKYKHACILVFPRLGTAGTLTGQRLKTKH